MHNKHVNPDKIAEAMNASWFIVSLLKCAYLESGLGFES